MIRLLAWLTIIAAGIALLVRLSGRKPRLASTRKKAPASRSPGEPPRAAVESNAEVHPSDPPAPSRRAPMSAPPPDLSTHDGLGEYEDADDSKLGEPVTVITKRFSQQAFQSLFTEEQGGDPDSEPTAQSALMLVIAVGQTDMGLRRKNNEDNYIIIPDQDVFVVADGMGGYAAGELASQIAVESIQKALESGAFAGNPRVGHTRGTELVRSMQIANAAIFAAAEADTSKAGMGTTIVAARFSHSRNRIHVAHVGDSRCYRLRENSLTQLTTDHTLRSLGVTGREAEKLTRAAGIGPTAEIDLTEEECLAGDQYLLCSDGLTKMLGDESIGTVLGENDDPEVACQRLIEAANARGGKDNTTVIVVRVIEAVPPSLEASGPEATD